MWVYLCYIVANNVLKKYRKPCSTLTVLLFAVKAQSVICAAVFGLMKNNFFLNKLQNLKILNQNVGVCDSFLLS